MTRRLLTAGLVALLALGSLALWTSIPVAWLLLTREISAGPRFVITVPGCAITMALAGFLLYRLEAVYARMTGTDTGAVARSGWLRSVGEGQPRRRLGLLDTFLVVSALVALVALVAWWAFIADSPNPSGPLQPL